MSRPALSLVPGTGSAVARQKSFTAPRLLTPAEVRDQLAANWGRFVSGLGGPQEVADLFDTTRQCAWNWIEGDRCRPSGHHVVWAAHRFGPQALDLLLPGLAPTTVPQLRRVA